MTKNREELEKLAYGTLRFIQEFKLAQNRRKDLDRVAFEILMLIKLRGQIRPSDIAGELDFNPSSITRRIQSLQQAGQIAVTTAPTDLRSSLISLTPEGEEVLIRFLDRSVDGLELILKQWNEEDVSVFAAMLSRFADTMKEWRLDPDQTETKE
ncbi:MarR family winged helix-turn-helix transcriptional regulator [Paenibacillus radicis (ex Xue et al. 2023)]|uniref:MarR family transcriptional regulator n=1 Tax=Paenibacillus radicis (ex Xue et al. 2023) TaxID=2972489 RepID=A0ABT1Y999_9BACL|nr:MarR family transcriptional regulator [Paenibacillus radicis (ex Xue et al. 2023)]MCR8629752.1 MarR family transcriptional regulator [Paenibacillus radicis (ex Xue et al. 2023)]